MLVDVYNRINNNIGFHINYLGGNHELMMYNCYIITKNDDKSLLNNSGSTCYNWNTRNGGFVTSDYLKKYYKKEDIDNICNFVGNLKIYQKFNETINNKTILLVHACNTRNIEDNVDMQIKDNTTNVEVAVWARKSDLQFHNISVGSINHFNIIGHTQIHNELGYYYDSVDNVLYIDGAAATFGFLQLDYLKMHKMPKKDLIDTNIPYQIYMGALKKI